MNRLTFEIIFFVIFMAIIISGGTILSFIECHAKASKQNMECSYFPMQGCMVKINGQWIDYDRLRVME